MKIFLVSLISYFSFASSVSAHGENKYGPHKGFVRMSGAFHTEVVPFGKNKVKVYLLDIEWKNPTVEKSNLTVKLNGKTNADCNAEKDFYVCVFSKNVNLMKKGLLSVKATRQDQTGADVIYQLPLKLNKVQIEMKMDSDDHSIHH
jgi:hypothetical protein